MMTDPLADMLARIRNAGRAGHQQVLCPASKLKLAVARLLAEKGYLAAVEETRDQAGHPALLLRLRYRESGALIIDGMRRVSKPSRRVYLGAKEVPRVRNGIGMAVLSTPKGVLSDSAAREAGVGGELMFEVW